MPLLHHALLGVSVVALAVAGVRLASPLAERGLARAIAAATFGVALAVGEAIVLGLVSLGGSTVALTLAALLTAGASLAWLPRPVVPVGAELSGWWHEPFLPLPLLGALAGAVLAWIGWQLRHPALGFDTIHYHLPEMAIFVQGGQPGSVHDVLPGLPVGNYPLTTEVSVAWAMGIARSLVPLVLWPWLMVGLTAVSGCAGLRSLGVGRVATGLAVAALCTNPWLLAWQSNGSVTDPPALAWLVTCAALCAMSRARPGLLAAAVVAGGLAIGCKTTVLPYVLTVLAAALWPERRRLGGLARPLLLASGAALLVGGGWYLRNLVTHGSPFWPIVAAPWGDAVPASVRAVHTSFLDRPGATVDLLGHSYLARFGGGLLLLGAGLLAPLVAWRRGRVMLAGAAVLVGLLVWARSPVTGIAASGALPETVFSTTRYALPVVAAACLALALAATDARVRLRLIPLAVLAGAVAVNLVQTLRLGFPTAPSGWALGAGALGGFAVAERLDYLLWKRGRGPETGRMERWRGGSEPARGRAYGSGEPGRGGRAGSAGAAQGVSARPAQGGRPGLALAALVVAVAAALAIPASGFVKRHAATDSSAVAPAVAWLANDPQYRDGNAPVATTPAFIGPLAGDRLQHRLEAIPPHATCAQTAARARTQFLVVYGGTLGGAPPQAIRRCLPLPAFDVGAIAIYRPENPAH